MSGGAAAPRAPSLGVELPPVEGIAGAPRYAPFAGGRYEVKAGLSTLGTDFGNGAADGQVFQIDAAFPRYRGNVLLARAERLGKYLQTTPAFCEPVAATACGFVARRLAEEHPDHFHLGADGRGAQLTCELTGETLRFDGAWRLVEARPTPAPSPPYANALDALASQVAEDLAVVVRHRDESDEVCAIHLCAANHWAAEEKVGRSFFAVHEPVPGIDPINRNAYRMVRIMEGRGPFVRFVWGIATDTRLNHHPEPPPGVDGVAWRGRRFDPDRPRLFVRVERQVTWGFPGVRASLFAIRNSFRDGEAVRADPALNAALQSALESMDERQARYKGVTHSREAILAWLRA